MSFFKLQQQRQTFFIYNFSKCAREPRLLTNKRVVFFLYLKSEGVYVKIVDVKKMQNFLITICLKYVYHT